MIKFVFFDVGGVVIKDFSKSNKWDKFMIDIGIIPEKKRAFTEYYDKLEDKANLGLDLDSELAEFNKFGFNRPVGYSMVADFVSRFKQNLSLWPVVEKLNKSYRIGLLTNMYPGMFEAINAASLLPPVDWGVVIDSSVVGLKKPQPEIYELAQKRAGVLGKQILFVDNLEENLEPAKNMGWQTFWYDSADYEKSSRELEEFIGY